MDYSERFGKPALVVVTGRPGSGKTTLAHTLARAIRCPILSRDELKEGLVNTARQNGTLATDINVFVNEVYFDTLERLLRGHITLVTEAAFQHRVWSPKLTALHQLAHVRLIHCEVSPELARTRFIERAANDPDRATFHEDLTGQLNADPSQTLIGRYEPPQLELPTLTVDTSDGYHPSLEAILAFARVTSEP